MADAERVRRLCAVVQFFHTGRFSLPIASTGTAISFFRNPVSRESSRLSEDHTVDSLGTLLRNVSAFGPGRGRGESVWTFPGARRGARRHDGGDAVYSHAWLGEAKLLSKIVAGTSGLRFHFLLRAGDRWSFPGFPLGTAFVFHRFPDHGLGGAGQLRHHGLPVECSAGSGDRPSAVACHLGKALGVRSLGA